MDKDDSKLNIQNDSRAFSAAKACTLQMNLSYYIADLGNILIQRILYHIPILGQKRILYHINILKKFVIYIISYIISFFGGKI